MKAAKEYIVGLRCEGRPDAWVGPHPTLVSDRSAAQRFSTYEDAVAMCQRYSLFALVGQALGGFPLPLIGIEEVTE